MFRELNRAKKLPSDGLPKGDYLVSCKFDGIRFSIQNGELFTRSGKPIPNLHIRKTILSWELPDGTEGEIISGNFQSTSSAVMTRDGEPSFQAIVFDCLGEQQNCDRILTLYNTIDEKHKVIEDDSEVRFYRTETPGLLLAQHNEAEYYEEIEVWFDHWADEEGIIIRQTNGSYGDTMWKWKHLLSDEAIISDIQQLKRKTGELDEQLGALVVNYGEKQFSIGTGFDEKTRKNLWEQRKSIIGKKVSFRFDSLSSHGIPRFPTFQGIRDERDMISN